MTKEEFYTFLDSKMLAVVSSVTAAGTPESAVVGFGQTKDLKLVFGTDTTSRKYKNLQAHPRVAFVIGWDNGETLQYEGIAQELRADQIDIVRSSYWKKNPHAEKYHDSVTERYFIVTPTWMRYTDLKNNPWTVEELVFEQ